MTEAELISVIIAVYNGERYLAEAIQSVLAQAYRPIEIIVIDDGSTDNSAAIACQFGPPVSCYQQVNQGVSAAHNQGVRRAHGSLLAFIDADDLWMADKLARQAVILQQEAEVDMVFGMVEQFYSPDLTKEEKAARRITDVILPGYLSGTMLIRKTAFERVGFFSYDLKVADFIDWYARAQEAGLKSRMLPEIVLKRRIHNRNMGIYLLSERGDYIHALKAALDRRRKGKRR